MAKSVSFHAPYRCVKHCHTVMEPGKWKEQ